MPRNADCFQLGELCSEQCVRPWVNPNAGDVIIKLWIQKLCDNSIGLTKQGRILYTGYLGLNYKFHINLEHTSSNQNWAEAVFGTCLSTYCLVDEDGSLCVALSQASGERLGLSSLMAVLHYRTSHRQPKGWLGRQTKTCLSQRLLFSVVSWKSWKVWVAPTSLASQEIPPLTPQLSVAAVPPAGFPPWRIACQRWGGWHLVPLPLVSPQLNLTCLLTLGLPLAFPAPPASCRQKQKWLKSFVCRKTANSSRFGISMGSG